MGVSCSAAIGVQTDEILLNETREERINVITFS
jgi:hypothetical protein